MTTTPFALDLAKIDASIRDYFKAFGSDTARARRECLIARQLMNELDSIGYLAPDSLLTIFQGLRQALTTGGAQESLACAALEAAIELSQQFVTWFNAHPEAQKEEIQNASRQAEEKLTDIVTLIAFLAKADAQKPQSIIGQA